MSGVHIVAVAPGEEDQRLDRWFRRRYPGLSHGRLEKLLRTGQVRLDGKRAKASTRVVAGQQVRVPPLTKAAAMPPAADHPARHGTVKVDTRAAAALRASVLYSDDWLVAIHKPAGLAVQGGTRQTHHLDAMLDGLRADGGERPRLVHRLDKDTSGVLLLARTLAAARRMAACFKGKDARKLYWALVLGVPRRARGRIDMPLAKTSGPTGEKVAVAKAAGKAAQTVYQVVATGRLAAATVTWLLLHPLTGRTHQLRVHCAGLGTPILGDGKYGGAAAFPASAGQARAVAKRLMLHAREIALPHPEDGTTLRVTAPLPADMADAWALLSFAPSRGDAAANDLLAYAHALPETAPGDASRPRRDTKRRDRR